MAGELHLQSRAKKKKKRKGGGKKKMFLSLEETPGKGVKIMV